MGIVDEVICVVAVVAERGVKGVRFLRVSSDLADRVCMLSPGVLPDRRRVREFCLESLGTEPCCDGITRGGSFLDEQGCFGVEEPTCSPSRAGDGLERVTSSIGL